MATTLIAAVGDFHSGNTTIVRLRGRHLTCPGGLTAGESFAMVNVEDVEGQAVEQAQLAVTRQGDNVRSLKASLKEGKTDKVSLLCAHLQRQICRSEALL